MKDILIQQSFHGYSEGHRLLESSIKLPDEIARLMLRMSDLSGGSVFPGFEEYLTGYPIAHLSLYVFAKTWYAAEMPRPGCVWTHSLILQSKDLDYIPSLAHLIRLFVRPKTSKPDSKSPKFSGSYANSIRFDPEATDNQPDLTEASLSQLSALVNALYNLNRRNLLVAASSSTNFENSILRLWSQQWPALRSNFSFCTGALSARGFAGKPFDVQFAPGQLIREITTSALAKQSQEMNMLNRDEIAPDKTWIDSVVSDAMLPNGGQFRKLLWSLADGSLLDEFRGFASLVAQFLSESSISLQDVIALVANQFPNKSSGGTLKKSLLGENRSSILELNCSEWEILSELSVSENSTAFDSESLNLRSRANQLCKNYPDDAKQLIAKLFKGPINSLGEDVLAGLLEAVNPEIARRITAQQPHFLPTLFRAKPELGTSADLWRAAGDHVRELFEALSSSDGLSEGHITAISEAIVSGGAEIIVRRALDKWGKPAVFGILNYVASSGNALSDRVAQALTFHDKTIMEWLSANMDRPLFAKVVCAHIVAPFSYQIKSFGSEIWLRTYEDLREQANYGEVNYIATLLLALGLQNTPPMPVKVIALCFEHIHQLTWDDKMSDANWIILDPIVPHLLWLNDWDKCERLRRGLIEAFVKFRWAPEYLHECVKNDDLLVRVLRSAKSVEGGSALLSKISLNVAS
jgi:hypothetical protein